MEELYKSLLSDCDTLTEQLKGYLFEMTELEGPVLMLVNEDGELYTNHPSRVAFLCQENPNILMAIYSQIDDGDDPCVCPVEGGCVIGTQLATEKSNFGYFLIYLPNYASETVHSNMDVFEILLAQVQLICQLIEKNNELHRRQLASLTRNSAVLCS
jgi:hypothetical protein